MKRLTYLAVVLPLLATAGAPLQSIGDLRRWTAIGEATPDASRLMPDPGANPQTTFRNSPGARPFPIGRIDTIGGTTYDWQVNGGAEQHMFHDPRYGTHATWMWSAEPSGYADRNMRYNFRGLGETRWRFSLGPEFMQWGQNVFTNRSGYGTLDVSPVDGCAYVSAHLGQSDHQYPAVGRDLAPGQGLFETDSGPSGGIVNYLWPHIAVSASDRVHMTMLDYPARTGLSYTPETRTHCD